MRLSIYRYAFAAFFFSIVAFPFLAVEAKMVAGACLLLSGLMLGRYSDLTAGYVVRSMLLVVIGMVYVAVPAFLGAAYPGSLKYTAPLYVVFPLFWLAFLPLLNTETIGQLVRVIQVAAWVVWLYAIGLLLNGYSVLPFNVPNIYGGTGATYMADATNMALASPSVSALLLLAPVLTFTYLQRPNILKLVSIVVFWIGILALGRRSAIIGLVVTLGLYLLASTASKIQMRRAAYVLVGVCVVAFVGWTLNLGYVQTASSHRIQETSIGQETERVGQTKALLAGFAASPIFGHGLGTSASVIRSEDKPWRYEMTLPASLFRYGVVGFGLICLIIGIPMAGCILAYRRDDMEDSERALICGSMALLGCYFFNPVFDTFDTLWVLFLSLLIYSRIRARSGAKTVNIVHLIGSALRLRRQSSQPS